MITIEASNFATAWEESVKSIIQQTNIEVIDNPSGGDSIEAGSTLIEVSQPTSEPRISKKYTDPALIDDFWSMLTRPTHRRPSDVLTIADRIYNYPTGADGGIDQIALTIDELKHDRSSRRAVVQIWSPIQDTALGATASGHCMLQFTLRAGALNVLVVSRSVDAWIGAVPNMLAFGGLQKEIASALDTEVGTYTNLFASYHLYLRDYPLALELLGRENGS